ncbi:Gfo/Idh/MocA family oxidoreductase [Pedobacter sp. HMF7647]|uniref:Gfo/Idh/MocA family oxidoreductase n=1 Tax=Hufsiella arboris TaxID=2695275 RepID=A0A7K1YCK1_9SPHI|nr:Gfo/Idh/MocA family oxidoreductase [Hufsiella arboris]MXV52160.1 Gfo/Idh/MocA family oxidoreductase [Hufsiella arboris]
MQTPIITGILSYGMSGRLFHAPFIDERLGFKLHAVTERTTKKAHLRYPEIISYESVEELLSDKTVELVIVNTPNYTHYEFAKAALEKGKHVLVEKPFTATKSQALELFTIAEGNGCKIMVYQNRRWDSDFLLFKEMITGGQLGNLIEVHFRFDRYKMQIGPKAFKETPMPASGITYDLGPHLLDQVISVFGEPLSFKKTKGVYRPNSQVDDYLSIVLQYPNQINVFVTASLLTADPLPSFVAHGTTGSFSKHRSDVQEAQLDKEISPFDNNYGVDGDKGILTTIGEDGERIRSNLEPPKGDYKQLFEAVHNAIRLGVTYPITKDQILLQLSILESN